MSAVSSRRHTARLIADQRGAVFVEFLIVILPLWVAFLCLAQLAFFAQADLLVKRAADAAARSASVVLPDDPEAYGGEPQMSVARGVEEFHELADELQQLVAWSASRESRGTSAGPARLNLGRSRLNTIRLAAHVPLMPLAAPSLRGIPRTVRGSLASEKSIVSSFIHHAYSVAVTFPQERDGRIVGPEVTVRVTYAYSCRVPVARAILCQRFTDLASPDFGSSPAPFLADLMVGRFKQLQHETTVLVQTAPYEYRIRSES